MDSIDREVLERTLEWVRGGRRVSLVTVIQTWGSAPRPPPGCRHSPCPTSCPCRRWPEPKGRPVVAADGVAMAGPDELVYIVGSREAAQAMPEPFVPVDHAIVGIVDEVALAPRAGRHSPVEEGAR